MILPSIRASFGRQDAQQLLHLLSGGDVDLRLATHKRLEREGLDTLLDDPRTRNALLTSPVVRVPPELIAYVLVRQALLEGGIENRSVADYVASVVFRFGHARRAYRPARDEVELHYLVDIVIRRNEHVGRERFIFNAHLGNFSLWLAGLFPQYVEAKERRRGAPPLEYYERMGADGFFQAAESREAADLGLDPVYSFVARRFRSVRVALNRVSDRFLWPGGGNPALRLLREIEQGIA